MTHWGWYAPLRPNLGTPFTLVSRLRQASTCCQEEGPKVRFVRATGAPAPTVPTYLDQDSTQSLREAIDEYYARNPDLLDPQGLPPEVAELFRQHDAGHVVFGCDTSLRGETLIDTWTVVASTAGLRGYLEYFKHPQVNQIFSETGYWRIAVESARCLPDVVRVLVRSRRMTSRWPWSDYPRYLDEPLGELRRRFNIRVVSGTGPEAG